MKDFESLKLDVGDKIPTLELNEISRSSLALYSEASGDNNPIHTDIDFAKESGLPDVIAHGMLIMSYLARALTNTFSHQSLTDFSSKFISMTQINDRLLCSGKVISKEKDSNKNTILKVSLSVVNQNGEKRITGRAIVKIKPQNFTEQRID